MRIAEVVRVDSKGRITIPMVVREALNIVEGMNLVLIADTERREIIISPIPSMESELYELHVELKDVPGALAHVSEKLASLNIDQITTQCTTIKRGEVAECMMIIDTAKSSIDVEKLREELAKIPEVHLVNIKRMKHS